MLKYVAAAFAMLLGVATAGAQVGGKAVDFPHAGVSLMLPEGYVCRAPDGMLILSAARESAESKQRSITLTVIPSDPKDNAATTAEGVITDLRGNLAFRNLRVVKAADGKIAGQPAKVVLLSYDCRGDSWAGALVVFIRELPEQAGKICYVLSIEVPLDDQGVLMPILGTVTRGLRLTEIRHPSALPVGELGEQIRNPKLGYAIRVPCGWSVTRRYGDVVLGQVDYLEGCAPVFSAGVKIGGVSAGATAKKYITETIAMAEKAGGINRVVSTSPARLGQLPAYQVVLQPVPKTQTTTAPASRPATAPAPADAKILVVHRVACMPGPGSRADTAYSIILVCQGAEAEKAAEVMDKLASGFSLVKVPPPPLETRPSEKEGKE
jgi:hypothetical protein